MTNEEFKLAVINAKLDGKLYRNGRCALSISGDDQLKHYGPHCDKITPIIFRFYSGAFSMDVLFITCENHTKYYRSWPTVTEYEPTR